MKRRPLLLFVCSALFIYFPLTLVAKYAQRLPIAPIDYVLSGILPLVLAFGLIHVTKAGWYTLIATVALWGVRDVYELYSASTTSVYSLLVHVGIYIVSLTYFINPRVRHVYFDPRARWWRSKPRYETHIPLMLQAKGKWEYPIMSNISEGGCFIETPHLLEIGEKVSVCIALPIPLSVPVIKSEGEVRWLSPNALRHGYGIQFHDITPDHQKAVIEYVRRQL